MTEFDVPRELVGDVGRRPRTTRRRLVSAAVSAVLLAAIIIWGLPYAAGVPWSQIISVLGELPPLTSAAAVALGILALLAEGYALRLAIPGGRSHRAIPAHSAYVAASIAVPGGGFLGLGLMAWMLRRGGVALPAIIAGLVAVTAADLLVTSIIVPLTGLVAYVVAGAGLDLPGVPIAIVVAVVGAVLSGAVLYALLSRRVLDLLLARLLGEEDDAESAAALRLVESIRTAVLGILSRRGVAMVALQLGSRVFHLAVLVIGLEALGTSVPLSAVLVAFVLGRILALLPLTPGGAGIAEAGTAAVLVALGAGGAQAAAASLLLMVATFIVPLVGGGIGALVAMPRGPDQDPAQSSS